MSRSEIMDALAGAALGGVAARAAYRVLRGRPPGGVRRWSRINHRGEPVTLLEGPAVAAAGAVAAALTPGSPARARAALAAAGLGAACFGAYDDLAGGRDRRGFRGHLGALARGEVTTGAVKVGGIGAAGLAAAAILGGGAGDVAVNAALIAGTANLVNLFDLRPGRAVKAAAAGAAAMAGAAAAARGAGGGRRDGWGQRPGAARALAGPLGAALALAGEDLRERAMLGDAGANALGAMLGVAGAASLPRAARAGALAAIVGLTAASEVVSFTAVIERSPALRRIDMLGRRPARPDGARGRQGQRAGSASPPSRRPTAAPAARPPAETAADVP